MNIYFYIKFTAMIKDIIFSIITLQSCHMILLLKTILANFKHTMIWKTLLWNSYIVQDRYYVNYALELDITFTWKYFHRYKLGLPAYIVDGNVSELLIHGWLGLPTGVRTEGRLGMFIGHIDLDLSCYC